MPFNESQGHICLRLFAISLALVVSTVFSFLFLRISTHGARQLYYIQFKISLSINSLSRRRRRAWGTLWKSDSVRLQVSSWQFNLALRRQHTTRTRRAERQCEKTNKKIRKLLRVICCCRFANCWCCCRCVNVVSVCQANYINSSSCVQYKLVVRILYVVIV